MNEQFNNLKILDLKKSGKKKIELSQLQETLFLFEN